MVDLLDKPTELGPFPITPENIVNGVFSPKAHQMFSIHISPEKFETLSISGHFRFAFEENSGREIPVLL